MRALVFDTSTIISLSTNDLLWILKLLKEKFKGDFLISDAVKEELIDYPLKTKKFKFEAIIISNLLNNNYLRIYSSKEINEKINYLDNLINTTFKAKGDYIKIMHKGEIGSLAVAILLNTDAYAVDERTTRLLIEDPDRLARILRNKLHTTVNVNKNNLDILKKEVKNIKVLRSTELALIGYELGLFSDFLKSSSKKDLIDGLLWGLKLRGCSITDNEISEALKIY